MSKEPIACTLDSEGFRRRMEEFRGVFERAYVSGERFPGGGRFRFRAKPGLEADIRSLADREQACCRFFRFEIFVRDDELWWETRVEAGAEPILDVFLELPDLLARRT